MSPGQSVSIRSMTPSAGLRSIQSGSFKRKKLSAWGCTPSCFTNDRHQAVWTQGWSYTPCHGHLQCLHPARSCSTWSCMLGCWCCAFRCRDQPEIPLQEAESFSSWLSVVLAGRWHGTLRAGSSLKSLFRRQKVFPLPAPSRQVALCASLGPPCP